MILICRPDGAGGITVDDTWRFQKSRPKKVKVFNKKKNNRKTTERVF